MPKNKDVIQKALKAHRLLRKLYERVVRPIEDHDSNMERIIFAFLVKSMRSQRALTTLCKKGIAEDAHMILRSIYESMVTVVYLKDHADEPEREKFLAKSAMRRREIYQHATDRYPADNPVIAEMKEREQEIMEDAEHAEKTYFHADKWYQWPKIGAWADAIGQGENHQLLYHDVTSTFAHADPYAFVSYIKERGGKWEVMDEPKLDESNGILLLGGAFLGVLVTHYNELLETGLQEQDYKPIEELLGPKYGSEMRKEK